MIKWLDHQVAPSLSVLYFGLGRTNYLKFMEEIAQRKHENLGEHQLAMIAYLQRTNEETYPNLPERKKL
jgi:hypothetical protein